MQQWALRGNNPGSEMVNDIKGANYPPGAQADVLARFLDTITVLVSMGFFVLLDNQLQQDKLARVRLREGLILQKLVLDAVCEMVAWASLKMQRLQIASRSSKALL